MKTMARLNDLIAFEESTQRAIDLEVKYERHMNRALTVIALLSFSIIGLITYLVTHT